MVFSFSQRGFTSMIVYVLSVFYGTVTFANDAQWNSTMFMFFHCDLKKNIFTIFV